MDKHTIMAKFVSPAMEIENSESLKRINYRLELRFSRYKEVEYEEYIGKNGSVYHDVIKLKTKKEWEEKLQ